MLKFEGRFLQQSAKIHSLRTRKKIKKYYNNMLQNQDMRQRFQTVIGNMRFQELIRISTNKKNVRNTDYSVQIKVSITR